MAGNCYNECFITVASDEAGTRFHAYMYEQTEDFTSDELLKESPTYAYFYTKHSAPISILRDYIRNNPGDITEISLVSANLVSVYTAVILFKDGKLTTNRTSNETSVDLL